MDREHEVENLRRSWAMAPPEAWVLRREPAMALARELEELLARITRLRSELRRLLDDDDRHGGAEGTFAPGPSGR